MTATLLDLERIDAYVFRGRTPGSSRGNRRVFGGQVAAQALLAAGRTVDPDRQVHSLHSYFLRPGDAARPIVYTVDPIRDGGTYGTRRVPRRVRVSRGERPGPFERVWLRCTDELPSDRLAHAAMAAFCSDLLLLASAP